MDGRRTGKVQPDCLPSTDFRAAIGFPQNPLAGGGSTLRDSGVADSGLFRPPFIRPVPEWTSACAGGAKMVGNRRTRDGAASDEVSTRFRREIESCCAVADSYRLCF